MIWKEIRVYITERKGVFKEINVCAECYRDLKSCEN